MVVLQVKRAARRYPESPQGMSLDPLPTRETLILRLRDPEDDASWSEFAEIYTPLLYGYCKKRGIQQADAADIAQDVMRSVALAMRRFEYDPEKGKFKAWLFTAVRHAIGRHFKNLKRRPLTPADSQFIELMESTPEKSETVDWERDYQRELLKWALAKVRPEFAERIWNAFEQTAVHGREAGEVADQIGMTKNAVAIAKFRVTKRLREKAESVDAERWEGEVIAGLQKA